MSKYKYDIEKLKSNDQREWKLFYSQIKLMIRSKEYMKANEFDEDIFDDMMLEMIDKVKVYKEGDNIINLCFAIYRNLKANARKKVTKFIKREYIQDDNGLMCELQPDHLSSGDLNEQEETEKEEYIKINFEIIKQKLIKFQEKERPDSFAKKIDLLAFYLDYVDSEEMLIELVEKYDLNSVQNVTNLNKKLTKFFGGIPNLKKGKKSFSDLAKGSQYARRYKIKKKEIENAKSK
jgi:hypothetical protein